MMEIGDVDREEKARIEAQMQAAASRHTFDSALAEASSLLSGISRGAGVVLTTQVDAGLKHVEFVRLDADRALVVLVSTDGTVENRLLGPAAGACPRGRSKSLELLNARLRGRTLDALRADIEAGRKAMKRELDAITGGWSMPGSPPPSARRRRAAHRAGSGNLLDDLRAAEDLERIACCSTISRPEGRDRAPGPREQGDGVRIFIGSENKLFSLSGSSMIAAPFRDSTQKIVGVVSASSDRPG